MKNMKRMIRKAAVVWLLITSFVLLAAIPAIAAGPQDEGILSSGYVPYYPIFSKYSSNMVEYHETPSHSNASGGYHYKCTGSGGSYTFKQDADSYSSTAYSGFSSAQLFRNYGTTSSQHSVEAYNSDSGAFAINSGFTTLSSGSFFPNSSNSYTQLRFIDGHNDALDYWITLT